MKIGKEGKRKLKASLANIALILSIFVVLFPLTMPTVKATGNTWIVPVDFPTIHQAIQSPSVTDGDTILVWEGIYEERITVDKVLTIQGNGSSVTTIQPPVTDPGTVITISASWVNVTGFT